MRENEIDCFDLDSNGDIYAVGTFSNTEEFGVLTATSSGGNDGYLVKISEEGAWMDLRSFSSSNDIFIKLRRSI